MPHADSSLIPPGLDTKPAFYAHIHEQLAALLDGHRWWVSNLAQASSLLYHAYAGSELYGHNVVAGEGDVPVVNWCGFYLRPVEAQGPLVLGPFHGRPACVTINAVAGRGVCADAFVKEEVVVVQDVDAYPGHIACDGSTKSEIVLPLVFGGKTVGVLDLDSTVLGTFDEADRDGLQEVVRIVAEASDWP